MAFNRPVRNCQPRVHFTGESGLDPFPDSSAGNFAGNLPSHLERNKLGSDVRRGRSQTAPDSDGPGPGTAATKSSRPEGLSLDGWTQSQVWTTPRPIIPSAALTKTKRWSEDHWEPHAQSLDRWTLRFGSAWRCCACHRQRVAVAGSANRLPSDGRSLPRPRSGTRRSHTPRPRPSRLRAPGTRRVRRPDRQGRFARPP